jgi:hypothetical protein
VVSNDSALICDIFSDHLSCSKRGSAEESMCIMGRANRSDEPFWHRIADAFDADIPRPREDLTGESVWEKVGLVL